MKKLSQIIVAAALTATVQAQFVPPAQQGAGNGQTPGASGQKTPAQTTKDAKAAKDAQAAAEQQRIEHLKELAQERSLVNKAEKEGVSSLLGTLCHFRGTWSQQLLGFGLVTGLDGSGDSQSYTATQLAAANMLKGYGMVIDPGNFTSKNTALVTVTCELPPYSTPGQRIDVTVSTMGDAKSLRNGTLIFAPLKYPGSTETYATAAGAISVGGYSASAQGNSSQKGFVTVGKVPGGAIIQQGVPTQTVIDGKMYLDLDVEDVPTAARIEQRINESYPELNAHALGGGTVEVTLPTGMSPSIVQSNLMQLSVQANTEAKVVIDERSGTIVIGGNVRIAPCAIAQGSISVEISQDNLISQPLPLSAGQTAATSNATVTTKEDRAQITMLRPNTTVADLADIFQALKLHAGDIIAILESLRAQGALKAKLVVE